MKATTLFAIGILFITLTTVQDVHAQRQRGGEGGGTRAGNATDETGLQNGDDVRNGNGMQLDNVMQQPAGTQDMQEALDAIFLTELMLDCFDWEGNGELSQNELDQAIFAVIQLVQPRMQMDQDMMMEQPMDDGMEQDTDQQDGMPDTQETLDAVFLAQLLLDCFDEDGNGELSQDELDQAMFAVILLLRPQTQTDQGMMMEQAMDDGMDDGMGQGTDQQNGMTEQNWNGAARGGRRGR